MRTFITENNITFGEGERNASVTTCIGYALHLGLSKAKLKAELSKEIKADPFIGSEIDRLYIYCDNNNYEDFWSGPEAAKEYKF